ncbi:MAG: hypothetical protein H0W48_00310 [Methylibium sp.]|nr:hypothetical protein [Methylibium sp.]
MTTDTELKVGDRIKDNDPREPNRILRIAEVLPNVVFASRNGRRPYVSILRRRIYTDGKPRRSGLSRIEDNA